MAEQRQHLIEDLTDLVVATGSEARARNITRIMAEVERLLTGEEKIKYHKLSPDTQGGIPESTHPRTERVAFEKAIVAAIALGLMNKDEPELADLSWTDDVVHVRPQYELVDEKNVGIWASDCLTLAAPTVEALADQEEMLRFTRYTNGVSRRRKRKIISEHKKAMIERYCKHEFFYVLFKIGVAYLSPDGQHFTAEWEVMVEFKQLPKHIVKRAYETPNKNSRSEYKGSAYYSGPGVDLVKLANKGFANRILLKDPHGSDEWYPLEQEIVFMLVRQGIMPAEHVIKMLATEPETVAANEEIPFKPKKIKYDPTLERRKDTQQASFSEALATLEDQKGAAD